MWTGRIDGKKLRNDVLRLMGSGAAAVLISFISMPIITRLYDPAVFGEFQILLSTMVIFGTIMSFRYEMAIVLPRSRIASDTVFSLSLILLLFSSTLFALCLFFLGDAFLSLINAEVLKPYLAMLLVGGIASGLIQASRYLLTREKAFAVLAKNRLFEVGSSQGLKIAAGVFAPTFLSLFLSQLSGLFVGMLLVFRHASFRLVTSRKRLWYAFKKYRRFMFYSAPAVFVNTLASQLPVFFIAKVFGTAEVGYYILAVKLIDIPLQIVGNAVSQVYFKEAADVFHRGKAELRRLYRSVVLRLLAVIALPTAAIFFLSEIIVPAFLGVQWSAVGVLMTFLVFWKFFEFVSYPVGTTLSVIGDQHIDFMLKILFSFGLRFFALSYWNDSFEAMMTALVVSSAVYYAIFNTVTYIRLGGRR